MIEEYQQQHRFLQLVNPCLKLVAVLAVIGAMIPIYNPWTPLFLFSITIVMIVSLGGISPRFLFMLLLPFTLFAFSFLWIQVVFPAERGSTILFELGPLPVALENVEIGASLGMRTLVFASWSLLFVLTTEPTKLMLSFIQQCYVPPRFGYGMMAAYRFLPAFREELTQIRTAHMIRGLGREKKLQQWKRYFIPLMASAIRKAERTAVAMESKAFDGSRNRSTYRHIGWHYYDILFLFGVLILLGLAYLVPLAL